MYTNGFIKDFDNFFDDYIRNFRQQLRKIKMELKKSDYWLDLLILSNDDLQVNSFYTSNNLAYNLV